jgi:hypothetical protein
MSLVAPGTVLARAVLITAVTLCSLLMAVHPAHAATTQTVGIHAHILWSDVDAAEMRRQLDLAKGAGAQILRVDVGWSSLEQEGKGQWSAWYRDRLDDLVTQADKRHLKLLLTVADSPCWASSAPSTLTQGCAGTWWDRGVQHYTPRVPADYADAFAYLIRRYGSRVAAWEIWNEPNSPDYYKAQDPVADYVALVKAAYQAGKAADPHAKILAGAVMQSDFDYTEQLYRAGIKGYFDAFSIHPYCEDRSPLDPWMTEWMRLSFIKGVPKVHDVMLSRGDHSPMWLTEFGWSTSTTRGVSAQANGVDEQVQARDVTQALGQIPRWSYVETAIYYNLVNSQNDRASLYGNYGLVRYDRSLKPAYSAFRKAAKAFSGDGASAPHDAPSADVKTPQAGATTPPTATATVPAPGTHAPKPPKASAPSLRRIRGGLRITGASTPRAKVRLRIFRVRHGRRGSRPTVTRHIRARASGRYVLVTRDRRLRHGSWRVVASPLT